MDVAICDSKRKEPLQILLFSANHLSLVGGASAFSESMNPWLSSSEDSEPGTLRYERVYDPKTMIPYRLKRVAMSGSQ